MSYSQNEPQKNLKNTSISDKVITITSLPQLRLILLLYDKILTLIEEAKENIKNKEYEATHHNIQHCRGIIAELANSLDLTCGMVAYQLKDLYLYLITRLIEANLKKDLSILEEAAELVITLREAWVELEKNQGIFDARPQERDLYQMQNNLYQSRGSTQ